MLHWLLLTSGCSLVEAGEPSPQLGNACIAVPIEPADQWLADYDAASTVSEAIDVDGWASMVLLPAGYQPVNAVQATRDGKIVPVLVACRPLQASQVSRWLDAMCRSRELRNKRWTEKGWPPIPSPAWCK